MSFLEDVLQRTKRLERVLSEKYGAEGKGLHEKTTSVERQLEARTVKQLRFIASVRNKLMHEDGYVYNYSDEDKFLAACDQTIEHLLDYQPVTQPQYYASPPQVFAPAAAAPQFAPPQYARLANGHPTAHYQTNAATPKIGLFKKVLMILGGLWLFGLISGVIMNAAFYFVRQSQTQAQQPSENKVQSSKLSSKILDSYVGQYDCKSYKITVARSNDSLKTSSSMAVGVLNAVSETEFAASDYSNGFSGRMKFIRNPKGKAVNLIVVDRYGNEENCSKLK